MAFKMNRFNPGVGTGMGSSPNKVKEGEDDKKVGETRKEYLSRKTGNKIMPTKIDHYVWDGKKFVDPENSPLNAVDETKKTSNPGDRRTRSDGTEEIYMDGNWIKFDIEDPSIRKFQMKMTRERIAKNKNIK